LLALLCLSALLLLLLLLLLWVLLPLQLAPAAGVPALLQSLWPTLGATSH